MESTYEKILQEVSERKQRYTEMCSELSLGETVTLEIGCGHGHFLTSYAQAHPKTTCIGVDLCTRRILQGKRKQERAKLNNLHFIKADATEFLDALPPQILINDIFILFPDPWPKNCHQKNRLIQQEFLELLSRKSLASTKIHFRTDHTKYFNWATNKIKSSSHWQLNEESSWPFEEESVFQKKMQSYQSLIAVKTQTKGTEGLKESL